MRCNLTRSQGFPLAVGLTLQQTVFPARKPSCLTIRFRSKPSLNPATQDNFSGTTWFGLVFCDRFGFVKMVRSSVRTHHKPMAMGGAVQFRSVAKGFGVKSAKNILPQVRSRNFSSFHLQKYRGMSTAIKSQKALPWLALNGAEKLQSSEKMVGNSGRCSSWDESAKRLEKANSNSIWVEPAEELETRRISRSSGGSLRESARRSGTLGLANSRQNSAGSMKKSGKKSAAGNNRRFEEEEGTEEEDEESIHDPRWDKIKNQFQRIEYSPSGSGRSEYRKWNKQEAWGKRTWKEATESSVPKLVGEPVYGVGPVLAALLSGRRETYALYTQEGLNLSGSNKKRKDRKAFEKVLKIAERIGLSVKETSKHDLNMVVDNRPHQGLVLDASPLEMVKIKELEPITSHDEKTALWLALDEITDPQNLGAIIRCAYFFGASGVVLCAKNSAPLSGVVSKASAGSLEVMELRYCKNMMQFLVSSFENGWRVLGGSVASRAKPLNEVSPGAPTILVLGSEGTGLRPLVERSCTELVRIPGNTPADVINNGEAEGVDRDLGCEEHTGEEFQSFMAVESLNVSVAAGVFLHHLAGNRSKSGFKGHIKQSIVSFE